MTGPTPGVVRAVVVGCGAISRTWLRAVREIESLVIVGLVDLDADLARRRAAEFGLADAPVGSDLGVMLTQTRPDAVFDCTVPSAPPDEDVVEGHAGVIREFVRCVREGGIPETVCTDNLKSLAMVLGAVESAARGERVAIAW